MKKCLIYLEGGYEKYSVELLQAASLIYDGEFESYGLLVSGDRSSAVGKFDTLIQVTNKELMEYDLRNITNLVKELQMLYQFDCILILSTYRGRMLAPRIAMALETGLVADVTQIEHAKEKLLMIRPAFSGKLMAAITNTKTAPLMMSIRPGIYDCENMYQKETTVQEYKMKTYKVPGMKLLEKKKKKEISDIMNSKILVSGGGGVTDDMELLEQLAKRLKGSVSASRRIVDAGKAPHSIQVGQSGKIVHPKLYIAAGIYGAIQHMMGLQNVEDLIAVNLNPSAPICSVADVVVEGDAKVFFEKLIAYIDQNDT